MPLKFAIAKVINYQHLTFAEAEAAMNVIMNGEATASQIGSYLTALRMKGETVQEIAGSAKAMRDHVIPVKPSQQTAKLIDTCGTGGDGKHTFNISTTAAFVVAGCGIKVAKHGNRAASSQSGSADLLLALGGNLDLTAEQVASCIEEVGIGFLYAVKHHPAMRYAIGARREMGQRTIFNLLGPLTNPAGATHQVLGVFAGIWTEILAAVLSELGSKAAFVVHGADGLDELSNTGVNRISHWYGGQLHTFAFDPQTELGMDRAALPDLLGGVPAQNAQITRHILSGKERHAKRDIVLLNAAAALAVESGDWQTGLAQAQESIDSGAALAKLEAWITKTNQFQT